MIQNCDQIKKKVLKMAEKKKKPNMNTDFELNFETSNFKTREAY